MDFNFDKQYVYEVLKDILMTDSPSGFTRKIMDKIRGYAENLGLDFSMNQKGCGIIKFDGEDSSKIVALSVHIDTLGLMVRSVKDKGTLAVTTVGSPIVPTLDGEYCKVYTRCGKVYTGTIITTSPSTHVYKDSCDLKREIENMEVRLDEKVSSKDDVLALGIQNGDYVCYDPKTVITPSDYVKSRFLDDKLSLALCFGVLKSLKDRGLRPKYNMQLLISNYEEVGHGMAHIPGGITELLAIDMGCVGADLSGDEYSVSICTKDSGGPYDYDFTSKLIELAKENGLSYAVDVFPFYSSDVSAALKGGNNIKGALIGPGVHASHGMERSHYDSVENTMKLTLAYLLSV